jgi:hypothetical protein
VHPTSPANVAALLMVLAAAVLIALTAIAVRPAPQGPVETSTQAAPGPKPRVHERDPSSARRTRRRGAGRRTARAAAPTPSPTATAAPVVPPEAAAPAPEPVAAAEPAPQEAATTPPPQPPETVVETYYRALDAGRFEAAWTILTPAVRASFGPFENWRAGYATTLSNSPRDIEVAHEGVGGTSILIAHELVTEDRSSCGPVQRSFAVRWRLVLTDGGWRATSLTAEKRSGRDPGDACPARHDPAGGTGGVTAG